MKGKQKYQEFCESEPDIPIFSQYWWLDVVCGESHWDVALVEKGGHIVGSMPYYMKKKWLFNIITMPRLTHSMGPYLKFPLKQRSFKKLSFEKNVCQDLISQLPSTDYFYQNFGGAVSNWLPFYWNNFCQTTAYTYVVDIKSLEQLDASLEPDIRRRRKKAVGLGLLVVESDDIKHFYELNKATYERHGKVIPYDFDLVKRLFQACRDRGVVKLYFAQDNSEVVAAGFFVFDNDTMYYLMGGIEPKYKSLGGMDVILYDAIKFAFSTNRKFDFEGSMVESIEKYFRGFGAEQKMIMQISKTNSKLLKLRELLINW